MDSSGFDPSQFLLSNDQSPQPTSLHPSGVPVPAPPQPVHSAEPSQTPTQNQQLNPVQGAPVPASLNPAAMAVVAGALTQLTNYVGNIGGVQGAMPETVGSAQYRGRGRRGGRPYRRGRGPYHGRGRGRGGDGRPFSPSSGPSISNVGDAPAADGTSSVVQPSSLVSEHVPLPNPAQVPPAILQPPACKFLCQLCKAECNSAEIFEQHKNGKRHKKNLRIHEEIQRLKAMNGQQTGSTSTPQFNSTIHPENVQESEKIGLPEENLCSEAKDGNHNDETELDNNILGVSEVQAENPVVEPQDDSTVEMGGGKYMKANDGSRVPVEPPTPNLVFPFICELCNAKCESPVVYNSHMTGKKHLLNLKRACNQQSAFGEAGRQPLQPPATNTPSNSNNSQVLQGASDANAFLGQLLMNVLSQVQLPATVPSSNPVAALTQVLTSVAGTSHESLAQILSQTQVSGFLPHAAGETENPSGEMNSQMLSNLQQLDATVGSSNNTENAEGRSATEENRPTENPDAANEQVPS